MPEDKKSVCVRAVGAGGTHLLPRLRDFATDERIENAWVAVGNSSNPNHAIRIEPPEPTARPCNAIARHMQARYNRVARNRPRVAGGWGAGAGARRAWTGGRLIGEAGTMREWSLNARPLTTVVAVPLCSSLWLWTCGWSVIPCSAFAKGPRTDRHRQGPHPAPALQHPPQQRHPTSLVAGTCGPLRPPRGAVTPLQAGLIGWRGCVRRGGVVRWRGPLQARRLLVV